MRCSVAHLCVNRCVFHLRSETCDPKIHDEPTDIPYKNENDITRNLKPDNNWLAKIRDSNFLANLLNTGDKFE